MGSATLGSAKTGSGRTWLRWLPAVTAPAVIAAGVLVGTLPARAGDPLPDKSPAEVLALLGQHRTQTFSGTLEQSSDLGLPELPAGPGPGPASAGGVASVVELLSGGHTARVYMDGPGKVRIQVVDRLAERDVVRNGTDLWFYSSRDNSTTHVSLPAFASDLPLPQPPPGGPPVPDALVPDKPQPETPVPDMPVPDGPAPGVPVPDGPAPGMPVPDMPQPETPVLPTPEDIARHLLAKVDPSTAVSVGDDVDIAGRTAYNLLLEPRTESTLVGQVAIAVDGETGMPLSVQVTARGAGAPAFKAGFTSLSLDAPNPALFSFVPPPGSTVEELQLRLPAQWPASVLAPGMKITREYMEAIHGHPARPSVTGQGWETVVEIPAAAAGGTLPGSLLQDPLLSQAAVVVPGGRLLTTALFNVLITDDGRILAGMVPADLLQAAASAAP